jgi:hypothetical protein
MAQPSLNLPFNPAIQPAASPVDQFHAPVVEAPNNNAYQLAQLGQALAKLEPQVADVFQSRFSAYQQNSQQQATRDTAEMQLDSMKKLRGAVADGKIAESENPWYMAQMEGEVGRTTARRAAVEAWNEYEQTPEIRGSDNVGVVDKFFSDRFAKVIQQEAGGSVWAAGAMDKVLSEAHDQLMQRHVAVRARERVEEREVSAKAEIGDLLSGIDKDVTAKAQAGDPQAIAAVAAAKGAMQTKLNQLLLTVNRTQANKWIKEAIIDHALATEDPNVAQELMGSLTTEDGKGLLMNDADRRTLKELPERISDLSYHRLQRADALDKLKEDADAKSVMATINKARATALASGQDFDYKTALTSDDISKLSPGTQTRLIAMLAQSASFEQQVKGMSDEQKRDKLRQMTADFLNGKLPPEQMPTYTSLMALAGGHHDLATIINTKRQLDDLKYPAESDIQAKSALIQDIANGSLSGQSLVDRVTDLALHGKLNSRDFNEWSFYALSHNDRETSGQDRGELAASVDRVSSLVMNKRIDSLNLDPEDKTGSYQRSLDTIMTGAVNKAKKDMIFGMSELVTKPNWKSKSTAEKQQAMNDLIDSVSKANGGYTEQESLKAISDRQAKEEKVKAEAEKKAKALADAKAAKAEATATVDPNIHSVATAGDPALEGVDATVQQALKVTDLDTNSITANPDVKRWFGLRQNYESPALTELVAAQHDYKSAITADGSDQEAGPGAAALHQAADARLDAARADALTNAKALGNVLKQDNFVGLIKQSARDIQNAKDTGAASFTVEQQQKNLKYYWKRMREYSLLRQRAGYSVDEIKEIGGDAYLHFPLFSSVSDINKRGAEVGKQLGLSPEDAGKMMVEQRAILERNLNPS